MTFGRITLYAAAICLTASSVASAQDPRGLRDQPIPRDLVEALVAGQNGRNAPAIVVGQLPAPLVGALYVPPGGRILGGMFSNASSTGVVISTMRPDSLREAYRREQLKLGWTELNRSNMGNSGGFRDPAGADASPLTFCSTGNTLTVQIDVSGISESRIVASATGNNICTMMQQARAASTASASFDPYRAIRWPILVNPNLGRTAYGVCPQTSGFGNGTSTELSTAMTPEDLFAHYGRQLTDSGWAPEPNPSLTRAWTRTDSLGIKLRLELRIETFKESPSCRKVSIQSNAIRH